MTVGLLIIGTALVWLGGCFTGIGIGAWIERRFGDEA